MRTGHALGALAALGCTISIFASVATGCGSSAPRATDFPDPAEGDGAVGEGGPSFGGGGDAGVACVGLQCKQKACAGGGDTTVTGTVFAPNGTLPLYNAIVYVPNSTPDPLTKGATCDKCGAVTGAPVVTALSDATGKFTLHNVPIGTSIPLVIQIGKWRRQVVIPEVKECQENALASAELTRLPRNQSEGDIPRIALTTGGCDQLGCMLPKIGLDASEFGLDSDGPSKSVHVYNGNSQSGAGGPGPANSARTFWNDPAKLKAYDLVVLSCECEEASEGHSSSPSKGPPAFGAMNDYLNAGGRIFTTDFMYTWYRYSPDPNMASATNIVGGAPVANPPMGPMTIDTSFPKGKALGDWLATVTPGSNDKVSPDVMFTNITSLDAMKSQQWATSGQPGPRVFTVNVPVGVPADQQCGKGVHIDAHLNNGGGFGGGGSTDVIDATYPKGCASQLREGEKLLAFFFFDLASCIQNDTQPPMPPQVK